MSSQLGKAAQKGDVVTLVRLLDAGADIEWRHKGTGRTALLEATIANSHEAVATLLEVGANIDHQCEAVGYSALMWASMIGSRDIVALLIERGAAIDIVSPRMRHTALMAAAQAGHTEITGLLLSAGADPNLVDFRQQNAWSMAKAKGHAAVVHLLEEVGAGAPPQAEAAPVIPWPEFAPEDRPTRDPVAVVRAYTVAVHDWELRGRAEFGSGSADAVFWAEADQIRTRFCTRRTRTYTRGSYSWPPEYAPSDELVSVQNLSAGKVEVVIRDAETTNMRYEHRFLVKRVAGEWRVDSVKIRMYGLEKWERSFL